MTCMAELMITTLAERPELIERVYDIEVFSATLS
jgi:hypothetical protein